MRSRVLAVAFAAAALAAFSGAALFVRISEQRIASSRTAARAFDAVVQQAVANVTQFDANGTAATLEILRSNATTANTRTFLDQASANSTDITDVAPIIGQLNAARLAEQQAAEAVEASRRKLEAIVLAATAGFGAIVILALVLVGRKTASSGDAVTVSPDRLTSPEHGDTLGLRHATPASAGAITRQPEGSALRAAAELCTNLGRVSDVEELHGLMAKAAEMMDASGLIVWMIAAGDAELRPTLSYGYSAEMLSRLPPLARSADNAAARAFRTSQLQIVLARPGSSNGAIVAPLLTPAGCVGVFSAETRGGGETTDSVQALAAIVAAQLANVVRVTPESHEQRATGTHDK